jgi:polyhydroxyalkanoate synthase
MAGRQKTKAKPNKTDRRSRRAKPRRSTHPDEHREADRPTRRGPRPLALHLLTAQTVWGSLRAALPALGANLPGWPVNLLREAESLRTNLLAEEPALANRSPADLHAELAEAVDLAAERRLLNFTAGVQAYRAHPYRRDLPEPPVLWRDGTTRLLDYGARGGKTRGTGTRGTVLVIPSLVNRAYVLDLTARTSLMRHLAAEGFRPLLVDWGAPGAVERTFGLDEYIAGRLEGALDAAVAAQSGPVAVLGYCMGGNLALALALRRADDVSGLACLATPWDFQADGPISAPLDPAMAAQLAAAIETMPECPVDLLQAMFASLDPLLVNRKYRAFGKSAGNGSDKDELFVAIEDWVNDGVPLAAKVTSQCLVGWYGENAPVLGRWWVAGELVDPARLRCPTLAIIPTRDRIVPPASAMALAAAIPQAQSINVPSGHVAMIVGDQAPGLTWRPLVTWLSHLRAARRPAAKPPRGRAQRKSA